SGIPGRGATSTGTPTMQAKSSNAAEANLSVLRVASFLSPILPKKPWPGRHWHIRTMTADLSGTFPRSGGSAFMLVPGLWLVCDDGIVRPVIKAEIVAPDGKSVSFPVLVDPAADRTVLSSDIAGALKWPARRPATALEGVGGRAETVLITTVIA